MTIKLLIIMLVSFFAFNIIVTVIGNIFPQLKYLMMALVIISIFLFYGGGTIWILTKGDNVYFWN
jgi:hypothetical protein